MKELVKALRNKLRSKRSTWVLSENTELWGDMVDVVYHNTTVASVKWVEGRVRAMLNTGGWYTPTTKDRINTVLRVAGIPATVYQREYQWFVRLHDGEEVPFRNRMIISEGGLVE